MRTRPLILAATTAFATIVLTGIAIAHGAGKADALIHYRHSVYGMIGWNFAPLAEMVKGKAPFDKAEFAKRSERIAFLSPQIVEGFPPGSGPGDAGGMKTHAKPEIWKNMDDFKSKLDDFVKQSQVLADTAKGGDEAKMKDAFKKTAGTCKACHDKYREDE